MQPPLRFRNFLTGFSAVLVLAFPLSLLAGGRAFNTLVVVNTNSADSVELGGYYAAVHGIPAHHICEVSFNPDWVSISSNEFQSLLVTPITNHIAAENLDCQIDFVVLCQEFPTRIRYVEGVSAALFYGFKNTSRTSESGCSLPGHTFNDFYRAERSFRSADGWNATNGFIAFHLMASNLPAAKAVADRGAAAQASAPPSVLHLYFQGDQLRGMREQRFAHSHFSFTALPGLPATCTLAPYYAEMSSQTNVMGYHDGGPVPPPLVYKNSVWLPGAYADHMTSSGGMVTNLTNATSQRTVLDWLNLGATASYGTVDEPCALIEKFPDPLMAFHYARGFTIGESYAMALENPHQGLFAGDPLAAPFAAPPALSVVSHTPDQIVTGTVPFQVTATAHDRGVPAAGIDLYLNERFHAPLVSVGPTPGNILSVAVAGVTNSTVVVTNQTLFDVVAALADEINDNPNQIVMARAAGDRLELLYKQLDRDGDNATVSAAAEPGAADGLTLGVGLAATNLHPSTYPARRFVYVLDSPQGAGANAGDTITCVVTLTNGVAVTNILVATQGESRASILERFRQAINTNSTLMATNGVRYDRLAVNSNAVVWFGSFFARTPGPEDAGIWIDYQVNAVSNTSGLRTNYNFTTNLMDFPDDLRARAAVLFHVTPTNGILEAETSLDTTLLADGVHTLDFIARDGSAVAAASRLTFPIVVCNSSPQLSFLGTNGAPIVSGEAPDPAKGNDFGSVQWDQPRTNVFSIHNNGPAPLAITGWTTNGPGAAAFSVAEIPAVVEAGGVSNLVVVFTAATSIVYEASLSFDSDAVVPQTNLLFSGSGTTRHTLTIQSAHGDPFPPAGLHTNWRDTVLTNAVPVPLPEGGTQLVCAGWAMTGHDPATGSSTNFTMTVTNDAVLTWLWTTNFWLEPAAGPNGSVNAPPSWQPGGGVTQVTAIADLYYHFTEWTGDVASTDNPLELLMDAPKAIEANFAATLATNQTPHWWLAQFGWTNDFDAAALDDPDEDGFPTWREYITDTDPTDGDNYLRPMTATGTTNSLVLSLDPTSTGRLYFIDLTEDLAAPDWSNVTNSLGPGGPWSPETPAPETGIYFYRGRVTLPP